MDLKTHLGNLRHSDLLTVPRMAIGVVSLFCNKGNNTTWANSIDLLILSGLDKIFNLYIAVFGQHCSFYYVASLAVDSSRRLDHVNGLV